MIYPLPIVSRLRPIWILVQHKDDVLSTLSGAILIIPPELEYFCCCCTYPKTLFILLRNCRIRNVGAKQHNRTLVLD